LEKKSLLKLAYQKLLLYRGLELYADRDYANALTMFKKSIDGQIEAAITARATFWKAETEYVLDDYKNALLSFKQFQDCLALLLHLNIKYQLQYRLHLFQTQGIRSSGYLLSKPN
jgi:hypothetical protein